MKYSLYIIVFLMIISCDNQKNNQSIHYSYDWKFKNAKDTSWLPAKVPGVVHLDLFRNALIDDPYRNNNELSLQYLENEDWIYQSVWVIDDDILDNDHIELEFEGLDTYAEVFLNDSLILKSSNMFRTYSIEVKDFLKLGKNMLRIDFTSPLNENRKKVSLFPYKLPSGNETGEIQVSSFTRKAAYQFGWDWGPRFVSSGIWRPIKINTWNDLKIEEVIVSTKSIMNNEAIIEVFVSVNSDVSGLTTLSINDQLNTVLLQSGRNEFRFSLTINSPKLWWPNGVGDQPLYSMKVELLDDIHVYDKKTINYGIRTVELVNEADSIGTSYYFKVNSKPIFMRGANYIPQDIFPSRVTNDQYDQLIGKVKEANMNMLRVWGGGIYERDYFYRLCDENGILVWQDLMFAGSMYPGDSVFHENVIEEVLDNVNRLKSHPSIALWCGNNEIEVAWKNWGWQKQFDYSSEDSATIWHNYKTLFHYKIPSLLNSLTPNIDYVSTSPLSNWGTPENFNHSSMHYWGVWHGNEPLQNYKSNVGRFMAEYGFQSFPSYQSLSSAIDSGEIYLDSPIIQNRQKSYIGNSMITKVSRKYFGQSKNFKNYILNSQKSQALALKTAIQAHRLSKPHCMGTLFWQLNDIWDGPSWSVLEYDLTPKLGFEVVKKWYQSIVVIPQENGDSIDFHIISDRLSQVDVFLIVETEKTTYEVSKSLKENERSWILKIPKGPYQLKLKANEEIIFEDSFDPIYTSDS